MSKILINIVKSENKNNAFFIWLGLIMLTLVSAGIAESGATTPLATLFVSVIVFIKGSWVIDEYMGLKHCRSYTRAVVKSYFYFMTTLVALTVAYSQINLPIS